MYYSLGFITLNNLKETVYFRFGFEVSFLGISWDGIIDHGESSKRRPPGSSWQGPELYFEIS